LAIKILYKYSQKYGTSILPTWGALSTREDGFIVVFRGSNGGLQPPERDVAGIEGDGAAHME
jgi:hypothetical protein